MSLPPELLNRVNKELTAKVQKAATDLARAKSMVSMQREVLREATSQLTTVRSQFNALQGVLDSNKDALRHEEEKLSIAKRQSEKASSQASQAQNTIADLMQRVTSVDDQLNTRRLTLKEVEEKRGQMEEAMLTWLADNAVVGEATATANEEMKVVAALCKKLQDQADSLQVKIRIVEGAVWEESLSSDQIKSEIEGTQQQRDALKSEVENIKTQLMQLDERRTSVEQQQTFIESQVRETEDRITEERKKVDALRKEAEAAQQAIQKTLFSRGQRDSDRARQSSALAEAQASLKEEERSCDELEIQLRVTREETRRMGHQRADLESHLTTIRGRHGKYEEKLKDLRSQFTAALQVEAAEGDEAVDVELMRNQRAAELAELDAAILRGQHILQQRRREMILAAHGSEETTDQYAQLQKYISDARAKQSSLSVALANLSTAANTIDEESRSLEVQINEERMRRTEANTELRRAYQERIVVLRRELEEYERMNLRARKSVEEAQSAMRQAARGLEGERDLITSLESDRDTTAREINRVITELEQLSAEKERVGSAAEGIHWQLEGMRQQAEALKSELLGVYHEQEATALAMKEHELTIKAQIDGLRVQLNAHQEEKSKMSIRFNAMAQRASLMKSRYEDLMETLARRVYGPEEAQERKVGSTLMITDGGVKGNQPSEQTKMEEIRPEKLEAHALLKRADEREALLRKGDGLDSSIVAAEKDLRQLTAAINKLQASYTEGRAMVREGHNADAVLFGISSPLLLTEGPNGLGISGSDGGEEALLRYARARVDESAAEALREEIASWEARVSEAVSNLEACKVQEARVNAAHERAKQKLTELKALCGAKERHLDELGRECDKASLQTEKSRSVAFQKQASLLRKKSATIAIAHVASEGEVEKAVKALLDMSCRHSPQCYYALRTLTDTYGLPIDVPSALTNNNDSPMRIVAPSLSKHFSGHSNASASSASLSPSRGGQVGLPITAGRTRSVPAFDSRYTIAQQKLSTSARRSPSSTAAAVIPRELDPNQAPPRRATAALVKEYVARQQSQTAHKASYSDPLLLHGQRMQSSSVSTSSNLRSGSAAGRTEPTNRLKMRNAGSSSSLSSRR